MHSNRPDQVLAWFLRTIARSLEVHVHNMKLQSDERNGKSRRSSRQSTSRWASWLWLPAQAPPRFSNLGVDVVISGGQT